MYDVDHIEEYSVVLEHAEDNLTLLCTQHHREKSNHLLPVADVVKANADPYNVRNGVTAPYGLHFSGNEIEFVLGSCRLTSSGGSTFVPIMVDDDPLLAFAEIDGDLGLYMEDRDEWNYPILAIHHNVLTVGLNSWDATLVGHKLTIRSGPGDIKLAVTFEVPNRVVIERAQLRRNGVTIDIHPGRMTVNGFLLADMRISAPEVGIRIGPQINVPPTASFYLRADRYDQAQTAQSLIGIGRDPLMRPWNERTQIL